MFRTLLQVQVQKHFPSQSRGRPQKLQFDDAYDDILRVVRTGMQWRELKPKHVSFITVFKTMHKWIAAGVFKNAYTNLLRLYARKRRPKYYCIDSSFVKNIYGADCTGRNPTDRGRRATKLSTIVDDLGTPFVAHCTPANHSDMCLMDPTLQSLLVGLEKGAEFYADKGYDSRNNRRICRSYGLRDRIFKRRSINVRRTHAKRGVIERFFSWIDKYRRLIVRYEKYITVYESMTYLAFGLITERRLNQI